jgi:hypothetical protein
VSVLDREHAFVTRFVRKLRGGSQPVLVEASDGIKYVLKFSNNSQGRNVLFNEAMGTELYRAAGLPAPFWKRLIITEKFIDHTRQCWLETGKSSLRPQSGLCFGSPYLERDGVRLWEILPGSSFSRVVNKRDFYLAWLLDICARHSDNRQALFEERPDGIRAVFIDHGHMFSGPNGESNKPHFRVSTYLDDRIYVANQHGHWRDIARAVLNIDVDDLWIRAEQLPKEWLTDSALQNFVACLCVLTNRSAVDTIAELIAGSLVEKDQREFRGRERQWGLPQWLLRTGVQGA